MELKVVRGVENLDRTIEGILLLANALNEYDDGKVYVDNDHPWDAEVSWAIDQSSTGLFAVADEQGKILAGPYRSLPKAEAAKAGAKVVFNVDVDIDDDEDEAVFTETDATSGAVSTVTVDPSVRTVTASAV